MFELRLEDIVLGMDRPIVRSGIRVALVTSEDLPSLLLQRVARIRPFQKELNKYIYLLLSSNLFQEYIHPIFTGVSVPHLSPKQIKEFKIAMPPDIERIAIYDKINGEINLRDKAIEIAKGEIALMNEYRTRLVADVVTGQLDVRDAAKDLPDLTETPASLEIVDDPDMLAEDEDAPLTDEE